MNRLRDSDRRAVEAAIREVERTTSAEFVAAVVRRVDRHHSTSLAAGLAAALAAGVAVAVVDPWASVGLALLLQAGAFAVIYALGETTPFAARLAPRHSRDMKVNRLARLLFFERGLARLPARHGILLLVALAERRIEIVADHGIDRLAGSTEWQAIVQRFAATARTGRVAGALETAIRELGVVMARHFPPIHGAGGQISDRLLEL